MDIKPLIDRLTGQQVEVQKQGQHIKQIVREGVTFTSDITSQDGLAAVLAHASHYYYETGTELMSDDAFDALRDLLEYWNKDHPYLKKVGAVSSGVWPGVKHEFEVGSLNKVRNLSELADWYRDMSVKLAQA